MKKRYFSHVAIAAVIAMMGLLVLVSASQAQITSPARIESAATKPTPKMSDGKPDFTGFWLGGVAGLNYAANEERSEDGNLTRAADGSIIFLYGGAQTAVPNQGPVNVAVPANAPPYKPEYLAKAQQLFATIYGGNTSSPFDPMNDCKPNGVPRLGISGSHIVMNPSAVAILYENGPGPVHRIIYTDGRKHPDRLDTSFMGHSVGRWEGDTLVIDTVGLNEETWLGGGQYQLFHSDQLHVVERWSRQGDVMTRTVTVEDPVMFTKPWSYGPEKTSIGNRGDYIQPQMCKTNDKAHLILQTPDNQFKCNWCQPDADAVYGEGAADTNKANARQPGQ